MAAGDGKYPIKSIWVTDNPATLRQKLTFGDSDPAEATVFSSWYLGNGELIAEAGSYNITGSEATLSVQRASTPNFIKGNWEKQPPSESFTPDFSHPLLQAIGAAVVWNGASPRLRYAGADRALVNSPAAFDGPAVRNSGRAAQTLGVSMTDANSPDIDLGNLPASLTEASFLVIAQSVAVGGFIFASRTSAANTGFDLVNGIAGVPGNVAFRVQSSTGASESNTVTGQNNGLSHNYFATWKAGDFAKLYADNPRLGGNGPTSASGVVTSSQSLKIGNRGGNRFTGFVGLVIFGTKQNISAGLELLENPWQVFKKHNKPFYYTSATTSQTLLADPGTYNITGFAADLAPTRTLSADPGAYNLTGSAATLQRTTPFLASPGAYSLVGNAATLARSSSLSADSGQYDLTGAAATLSRAVPLSADAGNYQLDGKAASLTQAKQLSANSGSYQVDGQAATFIRTYNLLAVAGAFNVTGSAASFLLNRTLSSDSGAYSINGVAASLFRTSLFPDPSDVRAGVVYGPGGIYVGTLITGGKVLYIFDD